MRTRAVHPQAALRRDSGVTDRSRLSATLPLGWPRSRGPARACRRVLSSRSRAQRGPPHPLLRSSPSWRQPKGCLRLPLTRGLCFPHLVPLHYSKPLRDESACRGNDARHCLCGGSNRCIEFIYATASHSACAGGAVECT